MSDLVTHRIVSKNYPGLVIPLTWFRDEPNQNEPSFQGVIAGATSTNRFYHADWLWVAVEREIMRVGKGVTG